MKLPRAAVSILVLGLAGGGCGPESQGQTEGPISDSELDRLAAEANPDNLGKADTPALTRVVGDIAPSQPATDDLAGARFLGFTFRADGDANINVAARIAPPTGPTAPGPETVEFLYRRTSCFGQWQLVARGAQVRSTRLPGEGEYMLVSGARSALESGKLTMEFSVDQYGKIVTDANPRPAKLGVKSWLPVNALAKLKANGISNFADIRKKGVANVVRSTGLSQGVVTELSKLASWLDVPWIDYQAACMLKRAGADKPEDYYRLPGEAQRSLAPTIPLASIPRSNPGGSNTSCVDLQPTWRNLPNPRPGQLPAVVGPSVIWHWDGNSHAVEHDIISRPWWDTPTRSIPSSDREKRWYPDPAQGWDVMAYQFGGTTGGALGYLLVANKYTGHLRLFVYIPGTGGSYNQLLANVSVLNRDGVSANTWTFPLRDLPAQPRPSSELGLRSLAAPPVLDYSSEESPRIGGGTTPPAPAFRGAYPTSAMLAWSGSGEAYNNLAPGGSSGSGTWVRAEIPTLYDRYLYPETRPFSFFPGAGGDDQNRRVLRVEFSGLQIGHVDLVADLKLDLAGTGVPMVKELGGNRGTWGAIKDTFMGGIGAGAAASGISTYLEAHGIWTAGPAGIGVLAASGAFFGLLGEPDPLIAPEYRIALAGSGTGSVVGKSYTISPLPAFDINLSGTFTPVCSMSNPEDCQPIGRPNSYQRCDAVRLGVLGFQAVDDNTWLDPRPPAVVPSFADNRVSVLNVGSIVKAPWAPVAISDQYGQMELVVYGPQQPGMFTPPEVSIGGRFVPGTRPQQRPGLSPVTEDGKALLRGGACLKTRMRWLTRVTPRNPRVLPYDWQYALDVTDRVPVVERCRR